MFNPFGVEYPLSRLRRHREPPNISRDLTGLLIAMPGRLRYYRGTGLPGMRGK